VGRKPITREEDTGLREGGGKFLGSFGQVIRRKVIIIGGWFVSLSGGGGRPWGRRKTVHGILGGQEKNVRRDGRGVTRSERPGSGPLGRGAGRGGERLHQMVQHIMPFIPCD